MGWVELVRLVCWVVCDEIIYYSSEMILSHDIDYSCCVIIL